MSTSSLSLAPTMAPKSRHLEDSVAFAVIHMMMFWNAHQSPRARRNMNAMWVEWVVKNHFKPKFHIIERLNSATRLNPSIAGAAFTEAELLVAL
jgi:hypothetical protein